MTLQITTEENEQRELAVTIEVPEDRVQKAMRQTARKLSRRFNIPGFRKGKAPYSVVVSYLGGAQAVRAETVEELVQPVFQEAMEEIDAEPYAQASFDDMQMEPLVLKFTIPLSPTIELGEYRSIRKEIEPVVITDEAVEEALERVQSRHAEVEDVDRPVELGDLVALAGKGELVAEAAEAEAEVEAEEDETAVDDLEAAADELLEADDEAQIIFQEERVELVMDSKKVFANTPFVENIVGMSAGESKTFNFTFADEYEDQDLAGQEATFTVTVLNVQKRDLPPLDDDLAKLEGEYETLDDLRTTLRDQLQEQAESEAQNERLEGMIDDLLKDATLVYPPAAVEQEIDSMIETFKNQATRSGWAWEDFLRLQGSNEESIREGFRETAVERLERQLVLRQFVLSEKLTVSAEDIDDKISDRVQVFGDNEELQQNMRNYYQTGYGFDMISSEILMDKAHERIAAILQGQAPDLDALDAEEETADSSEEE